MNYYQFFYIFFRHNKTNAYNNNTMNQIQTSLQNQNLQHQIKSQTIQSTKISYNKELILQKAAIVQQFLKNQSDQDSQNNIINYPNQIIQRIATNQLKQIGKLCFFKSSSAVYMGQTCNQLYHGYGLLIYKSINLRFYQGNFQNNCKYGYGFQFINGDLYVGKFINNKPQDLNGIFIWQNNDIYHGSFVNGMKHGEGKWQSGQEFYSGNWKYNKPEGDGYIKSSLSEYKGQVKNGYKHGEGSQFFNNGDRYQGQYSNGKPEGKGIYFWGNGSIYKGQFKNGLRFGYGIWTYGLEKYQGTYINDKRNGQGKYFWSGGSYYIGNFIQDLRHGYGEMYWQQNSYYKGEWFQGFQNGQGQIYQNGKLIQKGMYQNGKLKNRVQNQENFNKLAPLYSNTKQMNAKNHKINQPQTQRRRFTSYNSKNNQNSITKLHNINQRISNHADISKKNIDLLQRRKQINKRYSVLQNNTQKRINSPKKHNIVYSQLENEKKQENIKARQQKIKVSLNKINMYKRLLKQKEIPSIKKKITPNKFSKSFDNEMIMFETQLAPIKWKNFNNLSYN